MSEQSDARGGGIFAAWTFSIRVGAAGLAFVSQILIARLIGEEDFGRVAAAVTVMLIGASLATLGLDGACQRFVAQYWKKQQFSLLRGYLRDSLLVSAILGSVLGTLGALASFVFDPVLALAFLAVPVLSLMMVNEGVAKSYDWPILAFAPNYLLRPVFLLLLIGAVAVLGYAQDGISVMIATVVAAVLALVVQAAWVRARLSRLLTPGPREHRFKGWVTVSAPMIVGELGLLVMISADVIVLRLFRDPAEVGIYFAAIKSLALVQFVSYAVANASAHRVSAFHVSGEHQKLRDFVRRACIWTFLPSLAFAVLLLSFGKPILSLFGPAFLDGWPAMVIVTVGYLVRAAMGPAERVLNMIGGERTAARIYVAAAILAVALNLALVPTWGITGAATALAATMCFETVVLALCLRRRLLRLVPVATPLRGPVG